MVVLLAQKSLSQNLYWMIWNTNSSFLIARPFYRNGFRLHYELVGEEGPDHLKQFIVEARLGDRVIGRGVGRTKKAAEQEAAYHALTGKDVCI